MYYILQGRAVVECPIEREFDQWCRSHRGERLVRSDSVYGTTIHTVFVGINNALEGNTPLVFNTVVLSGRQMDEDTAWCSTWDQAEIMHAEMIERVLNRYATRRETRQDRA